MNRRRTRADVVKDPSRWMTTAMQDDDPGTAQTRSNRNVTQLSARHNDHSRDIITQTRSLICTHTTKTAWRSRMTSISLLTTNIEQVVILMFDWTNAWTTCQRDDQRELSSFKQNHAISSPLWILRTLTVGASYLSSATHWRRREPMPARQWRW